MVVEIYSGCLGNKMKRFLLAIFIAVLPFVENAARADEKEKLTIGVIATLTGVGSYQGKQTLRGLEIAKGNINASGGVSGKAVELLIEDSMADLKTAVSAFNRLEGLANVRYIVGDSWNSSTVPLLPKANSKKVILVSPAAALDQLTADDFFFRTIPSVSSMMNVLASYAHCVMGSRRVGIIYPENSFGIEHFELFSTAFEALGGSIVGSEQMSMSAGDNRTELLRLKSTKPDTILNLHASGPPIGLLIKQANQLGIKGLNWLTHFGAFNADLRSQYGNLLDGLTFPYPYNSTPDSRVQEKFSAEYQSMYNELPDMIAAMAYDALLAITKGIESEGDRTQRVRRYLTNSPVFDGAAGKFKFDRNGDVGRDVHIVKYENGRFSVQEKHWRKSCGSSL